jgi:hypothetical protein
VQAAADLLRQGLPTTDVTRILEAMQRGEESGSAALSHASTSASGGWRRLQQRCWFSDTWPKFWTTTSF